jgi:hypothetical protein
MSLHIYSTGTLIVKKIHCFFVAIVVNDGRAILSTPVYEEKATEARLRQRHPFATEKGVKRDNNE